MFKFKMTKPNLPTVLDLKVGKSRYRVGYNSPYAIYVHERVEMKLYGQKRRSDNGVYWSAFQGMGQAKYLEQPLRELTSNGTLLQRAGNAIGRLFSRKRAKLLDEAALEMATEVMDRSLELVPVDYGRLHLTGYIEED